MGKGWFNFLSFRNICKEIATSDSVFDNFKSHADFISILEHTTPVQGQGYINEIRKDNPELLNKIVFDNDKFGNPFQFKYDIGKVSPSTLRYMKVASDLIKLHGSLEDFNIVEIGGGYGGQCFVLSELFNFKSYTLIDLPEVLEVQKKYLKKLKVKGNLIFKNIEEITSEDYDLVISNYAFSEVTPAIREVYLKSILKKSKRGYLTMNGETKSKYKPVLEIEFKKGIILPERPYTSKRADENYIFVWQI